MKTSVIIPTYNRPQDLKNCLESIVEQFLLPDEVIVIDDGDLDDMPCRKELEQKGIQCVFKKKSQKGLTRSRNLGVKIARGDIIIFFDDDVVLTPDYIREIVKVYDSGVDNNLGGVGGVDLNLKAPGFLQYIEFFYNFVFLISPMHPGGVTLSGFSEQVLTARVNPFRKIGKADTLGGSVFSFDRKVFKQFLFSEDYTHNYCQGEDKDFSLRVSQKYNLYIQPAAKLYHYPSPIERPEKYRQGRDIVLSAYRLFSRYIRRNKYETVLFYYSFFGYFLKFLIRFFISRKKDERERIKGFIDAFGMIRQNEFM